MVAAIAPPKDRSPTQSKGTSRLFNNSGAAGPQPSAQTVPSLGTIHGGGGGLLGIGKSLSERSEHEVRQRPRDRRVGPGRGTRYPLLDRKLECLRQKTRCALGGRYEGMVGLPRASTSANLSLLRGGAIILAFSD